MKKNIKVFQEKLQENEEGVLSGGFNTIKGGFKKVLRLGDPLEANGTCTNSGTCGDSNDKCTNSSSCLP